MPHALPIACSLDAAELSARLDAMAELGDDALLDSRVAGRRAELRFAARAGVRDRLDAIVAAEARCCAFLAMRVAEERDTVVLTIAAPEGAEPVLEELAGAFSARGGTRAPRRAPSRGATASG